MNWVNSLFTTFAEETTGINCVQTAIFGEVCDNCNGSATMHILAYAIRLMTIGVGILAVIGILTFGIKYLTSRGDESLAKKARRHLFEVLIGVVSYIVLIATAGWILPGNLTLTMLGGEQGTCPEKTSTSSDVVGGDTSDPDSGTTSTDPGVTEDGWKTGDRPRECGPGTPSDFQTLTEKGYDRFYTYTNSAGRVFVQYKQADSAWGKLPLRKGGTSTMASAGCCHTSYAMISESYSSDKDYFPSTGGDHDKSKNTTKIGSTSCTTGDCDFDKIKEVIDQSGVVLIHACGSWGKTYSNVGCGSSPMSTHWFLLVDYRVDNGKIEYFFLNTGSNMSSFSGKNGTGWGTFGGGRVEKYTLYFRVPKEPLDCKVR